MIDMTPMAASSSGTPPTFHKQRLGEEPSNNAFDASPEDMSPPSEATLIQETCPPQGKQRFPARPWPVTEKVLATDPKDTARMPKDNKKNRPLVLTQP